MPFKLYLTQISPSLKVTQPPLKIIQTPHILFYLVHPPSSLPARCDAMTCQPAQPLPYRVMKTNALNTSNTNLEDLEASDVQNPNEVLSWQLRVQLLVDASDHPQEQLFINGLGKGIHRMVDLWERLG